jgi:hypothetical protein
MNIGEPERILTIEPIVSPVQRPQPPLETDENDPRPEISAPEILETP